MNRENNRDRHSLGMGDYLLSVGTARTKMPSMFDVVDIAIRLQADGRYTDAEIAQIVDRDLDDLQRSISCRLKVAPQVGEWKLV